MPGLVELLYVIVRGNLGSNRLWTCKPALNANVGSWLTLTTIVRSETIHCRNFLWIEDQATGETIWGSAPVKVTG
jgi:ABC-type microcin C transport system permease subunit YejE